MKREVENHKENHKDSSQNLENLEQSNSKKIAELVVASQLRDFSYEQMAWDVFYKNLEDSPKVKVTDGEDCSYKNKCVEDCINAAAAIECTEHNCNVGSSCGNR